MFKPERVKALREARSLTTDEPRAIVGLSSNIVARYEMGNRNQPAANLERLGKALRTTPAYLNPPDVVPQTAV